MAFRFSLQPPKSLLELFERLRELLPQVELKVLASREIGTSETPIAHGLKSVPVFVRTSNPHCIAVIRKTKNPDSKCVYLRATNRCVADVWVLAVGNIGKRQVENGGYHLPDWNPQGTSDHKFSVDAADEAANGYDYAETKIVAGSGTSISKVTGTHGKALQIACTVSPGIDDHKVLARNADATTVGGLMEKTGPSSSITPELYTDPVTGVERVRFNAAPATPPAGEGSWLYTGSIQASNLLDPVKAFVKSLDGMGGLDPGQAELFDVLENGDYQHKAVGQLYGLSPDGTQAFALSLGQRVWLATWQSVSDSRYRGGICTVQTLGDGSTKSVLRPTADVLAVGSMFKVEGVGAQFEGWYWEVLSLPDMVMAYRPDYQNETTYNLLTTTQVSKSGSVTRETSVTIPGGSSGGVNFAIPIYEMLDGIGLSTIPKGVVNWQVLAYVTADDPVATTFIRAFLSLDQGVLSRFGYGDSKAIRGTAATLFEFQGAIANDIACDPTDKLSAVFYGYSNSATDITIKLVYNSASHATRVQTPIETASYGTLDHQLLTPTSRGFTAEQVAEASRSRHPRRAVEDFASIPLSLSSENLTPDPTADTTIISTEQTIARIDSSQWPGGFCRSHRIFFINGGHLRQGLSPSGDFLSVDLGNFDGLSGPDCEYLDFNGNGVADLMLIGGGWRLVSYYTGRKSA